MHLLQGTGRRVYTTVQHGRVPEWYTGTLLRYPVVVSRPRYASRSRTVVSRPRYAG